MSHRVPNWYRNAKLGIMVHWGLPSVPAFAPANDGSATDILAEHDWSYYFRNNPYSEWYQNSLRLPDSPTRIFHNRKFNRGYPYERLAERFNDTIRKWDPNAWAELFTEAGARYVVLVAKHHDGFLLWPSDRRPARDGYVASRDVVEELGTAVRQKELRYGLYYSGLLDWTVQKDPIGGFEDLVRVESDAAYAEYARHHFTELIERYRPDILWNDIGIPAQINRHQLFRFYRDSVPGGVLNDRWMQVSPGMRRLIRLRSVRRMVSNRARRSMVRGEFMGKLGDVATCEYAQSTRLSSRPWEAVRSIGNSFAYNESEPPENYVSGDYLVKTLADVVSKNGNLLLNLGPRSDGTIPAEQRTPLLALAAWLRTNGAAIYDTRPWYRAEGRTADGQPVRFTTRPGSLFAILLERPVGLSVEFVNLDLKRLPPLDDPAEEEEIAVYILGSQQPIQWRFTDGAVQVRIPGSFVPVGPLVVEFRRQSVEHRARPIELYTDVIG